VCYRDGQSPRIIDREDYAHLFALAIDLALA
jgi:hypothetical protein